MSDDRQADRASAASLDPPDIPQSQLTRMDPDSILADEADPDGVLGNDSESEPAGPSSKRTSTASAIFSNDIDRDHGPLQLPKTPELDTNNAAAFPTALQTPRQAAFHDAAAPAPDPSATVRQLEEQVKDLTNQVTGLNGKLVKSFERISDLEDDLSDSQERVKAMSAKIAELEKERQEHLAALNTGLLVEKAHVSSEMQRMMDRVIEETAQRGKAESDKQRIESELDELSSSLFNEANKMVAVERLARARAEEKSRQMEERLKDTEGIMLDQQRVLADLQRQVEKQGLRAEKTADDALSIVSKDSGDAASFHRLNVSALARSASQRTSRAATHVVLGTPLSCEARVLVNIVPYQEFRAFVAHLRRLRKQLSPFYNYPLPSAGASDSLTSPVQGSPRTPSSPAPSQAGALHTSMATFTGVTAYSQGYSNSSNSGSPFAAAGLSRHRDYPQLPSTVENMVYLPSQLSLPFIKRAQEEDVDPCLRLDFAPGLNWLTRRQANTAVLEGNLVIEPIFPGGKPPDEDALRREHLHLPPAACALCGIPIVNVPLPGGNTSGNATSDQSAQKSLVPSSIATATTSWASSAANSLREVTGTGNSRESSGTLSTKSSRPSLFSSFRRSGGTTKSASTGSATLEPESPVGQSSALPPNGDEASGSLLQPSPMDTTLPVPTHIFRIQEGATTRYLLCPHHCLARLRAACQFWGFIRTMERSVVLEGKFATEEASVVAEKATVSKAAPAKVPGDQTAPAADGVDLTASRASADAAAKDPAAGAEIATGPDAESAGTTGKSDMTSEGLNQVPDVSTDDAPKDSAATLQEQAEPEESSREGSDEGQANALPAPATSADDVKSDEEDGFADAVSSPKAKAEDISDDSPAAEVSRTETEEGAKGEEAATEAAKGDQDEDQDQVQDEGAGKGKEDGDADEDETETPLARSTADLKEASDDTRDGPTTTTEAGEATAESKDAASEDGTAAPANGTDGKSDEDAMGDKPVVPPPVPRRSAARGSGASSPAPTALAAAPTLPPRRVPRPQATSTTTPETSSAGAVPATAPTSAAAATASAAPPPRTTLLLGGDDAVDWEDKMWTEITRLKEELWKARVGLVVDEA
ncbi:uncharacterized protein PFL1_06108 [Pseudozyma flocculosa PF-1]|uniref:Related to GTPase activating protein sec2 n=2 Tax=Pseudozyma flocculosa TaxID=84751 RepID=A0A5C3F349_9BASI|nr:uncharacterized protein PFL1_06108 [Pseudozyma flocculosa PF-1]EPQ26460.1 hypothetical protein PFL1_06108 [Pseudozyma flocculosa PF-1]SPO38943.1 related to GTPase activating protein sec2 [Pseudozyma flocculosa]